MSESIIERYRKQLEFDKANVDNDFPENSPLDETQREEYVKCLNEMRNDEIDMENQYYEAMNKIIKLKEKELVDKSKVEVKQVSNVMVKRAYCPNCGAELTTNYPPMFNPFTHEKQCIHECKCGLKYNLEYAYPRIVFYDENNNEIIAHCE